MSLLSTTSLMKIKCYYLLHLFYSLLRTGIRHLFPSNLEMSNNLLLKQKQQKLDVTSNTSKMSYLKNVIRFYYNKL